MVLDKATSLLGEEDEYRLVERLVKREPTEELWLAVEYMLTGKGATKVTAMLGASILASLYRSDEARASSMVQALLDSSSVEDLDLAIRIVNDIEDPSFVPPLRKLLRRPGLPDWLQETIEDAIADLECDPSS